MKAGDKVKYTGTNMPDYTGKMLEVQRVAGEYIILYMPEEDRGDVAIEGAGVWEYNTILCDHEDIEVEELE